MGQKQKQITYLFLECGEPKKLNKEKVSSKATQIRINKLNIPIDMCCQMNYLVSFGRWQWGHKGQFEDIPLQFKCNSNELSYQNSTKENKNKNF